MKNVMKKIKYLYQGHVLLQTALPKQVLPWQIAAWPCILLLFSWNAFCSTLLLQPLSIKVIAF